MTDPTNLADYPLGMADPTHLYAYPPGMTGAQVQEALGISEHSRRQLEAEAALSPIKIGRRSIYPRWQVFAILSMVDPDVAAADAAREVAGLRQTEAPPAVDDAPDNLVPLDPPRSEVAL